VPQCPLALSLSFDHVVFPSLNLVAVALRDRRPQFIFLLVTPGLPLVEGFTAKEPRED
jgi:hypothetical protein